MIVLEIDGDRLRPLLDYLPPRENIEGLTRVRVDLNRVLYQRGDTRYHRLVYRVDYQCSGLEGWFEWHTYNDPRAFFEQLLLCFGGSGRPSSCGVLVSDATRLLSE